MFSVSCQDSAVAFGARDGSLALWDVRGRMSTKPSLVVMHHSPVVKVCTVDMHTGASLLCSHADGSITLTDTRGAKRVRNLGVVTAADLTPSLHWDMATQTFIVPNARRAGVVVWPLHAASPAALLPLSPRVQAAVTMQAVAREDAPRVMEVWGALGGLHSAPMVAAALGTGAVMFTP